MTQMHKEMERIQAAAAAVRRRTDFVPEAAVVLGSGLGGFADMVRQEAVIPYGEIPGFPVSTAPGHAGRLGAWLGGEHSCGGDAGAGTPL